MGLLDFLSSLGPDELAAKRKAMMQSKLDAAGNAAQGLLAPTTGTFTEGLTRALPLTGEAWTANDAGNAAKEGNYGQAAAMGLLGLLPLGGMMAAGLRAGVSVPKRMGQSGAIAYHGSPSGGLLSSTWKQNDVFGTGTHIEHIAPNGKDAVIQQVAPSGKVSFYPASVKDGSVNPLNWNAFNSLEEAQTGLTGQKISESLKSRNKSLYGSIPNTWKGEERALAKKVIDEFGSAEFRQSTQSKSKYLILPSGEKIRMSDHSLPLHYEGADHEFRFGSDIADFIKQIRGGTE